MENLIFSLNATVPVFLLMLLGVLFRKLGIIDEVLATKLNKFVFTIPLPVLVFKDLAVEDFKAAWDGRFVLFCFVVTILSILLSYGISLLFGNRIDRAEFVQSSYRSSAALLGIAFIQNLYGTSGMAPLMIIGSVPLYNVFAVIILTLLAPVDNGEDSDSKTTAKIDAALMRKTLLGIVKNPIIIGIAIGLLWSLLRIPLTGIPCKIVDNLAATATPLGLMAMGATFDLKKALESRGPAVVAAMIKLVLLCVIFLPVAVGVGYRTEQLVAILVMLGSATTVSCFVMAKNMGHEGTISSAVVMLTTLLSAFTLTFWIWLLRSFGLI